MKMPSAPQGMTPETTQYRGDMILYGQQEHDKTIALEMNARDEATRSAIAGEMATLKAMTESLHSEAGAVFQRVTNEADAFTKKLEAAEADARARVEDFRVKGNELDKKANDGVENFRVKGNELDKKVSDGFSVIDKAIIDMRTTGAAQATTGDAALARFDTLVAQSKITLDSDLREIIDKIRKMESRG